MEEKNLGEIDSEIKILQIQKELIDSKSWGDKTHLERKYEMHLNKFYDSISELCISLGLSNRTHLNENGVYSLDLQSGENRSFDITRDYTNKRSETTLVSHIEINDKTKAHALLFYRPTKGIIFEYGANLMPEHKNIQLGKSDYFGKNIENIIKNISSATNETEFDTSVKRFEKFPKGLKYFYMVTKDFVSKEKQGDVISSISFMDSLVHGLHKKSYYFFGENFKHQDSESLFKIGIEISI